MCKLEGVWGTGGKSTVLNLGCRWSLAVSFTPRLLYQGGKSLLRIEWEVGWGTEPVWTLGRGYTSLALSGN